MRRRIGLVSSLIVLLSMTSAAHAAPPRVVSALPDNGQTDVDPTLKQIKIVFDQPMSRGGQSVVGGGPTFPKLIGQPKWIDDRTFVMTVQLQPDHDYWLSINSESFTNFRNANGEPAVPYPISFSTASPKAAATAPSDANQQAVRQLRAAIDENYSYRDLRGLDWDKLFAEYGPKLERTTSARAFARLAATMLAAAKDVHLVVKVEDAVFPTHRPGAPANFDLQTIRRLVSGFSGDERGGVFIGRLDDGVTYILITNWNRHVAGALEGAFDALGRANEAKGVVIDVRPNGGGDEMLARSFAGCFVDQPRVYSRNTIRSEGKWLGPFDRIVEPNPTRARYSGPVVVLMGPQNMSSCESFLLMMRQVRGCKLIGAQSYGSSGNPKPIDLANGVTVLLPSWQDMLPDGAPLEGVGVTPDIEVKVDPQTMRQRDPIVEAALEILRERMN